jgi:hypothetical protein
LVGCPAKEDLSLLTELILHAETSLDQNAPSVHSLLHSDLGAQLPLHISLSRPVVLRTEQRAPFTELLQKVIHDSHISPYVLDFKQTPGPLIVIC